MIVSLCGGATVDTVMAVWPGSGCPVAGTQLACNDNACGTQSSLYFNATNGSTYLIQIGAFNTTSTFSGIFVIQVGTQAFIQHPITLEQMDWDSDSTGIVPLSEYGHLQFNFVPAPSVIRFCNIVARLGAGGVDQWIVRNMPLLDAGTLGAFSSETCQTIDLSGMGVVRGISSAGQTIFYTADASSIAPIPSMPPNTMANSLSLSSSLYCYGGKYGSPVAVGLPPPAPPVRPAWNGSFAFKLDWRRGMPNGEQGKNQCGPAAFTNSMHWMQFQYFPNVNLNFQTWNDTLAKFKLYCNLTPAGINDLDGIIGKLEFATDPTKFFNPGLVVKYEADATTGIPATVTVNGQTAIRHGGAVPPSFAWILSELQHGEDVEVSVDWLNAMGNPTGGGHIISVTGALLVGNKMYLWTNDDGMQGAKVGIPPIPPVNGGLRWNMLHQVTIENGGYMRLSGFMRNNRVVVTFSESLGNPNVFLPFCAGDGIDPNVTTPCPCGNFGSPGNGCASSVNPAGALLQASGSPNPDTVLLQGSGMPTTSSCIYLQGDNLDDTLFGDGVRCVGGSLIRLRTKLNVGGASQYPEAGDPLVSVRGMVTPGSGVRRYYQTYYRNAAAAFCPPLTFNVTSGIVIDW